MSTEVANIDQSVLAQKKNAWANMGEAVYKSEMQLQASAQAALKDLTLPLKIEDVPESEDRLRKLKSAQKEIEKRRKEITTPLDELASRLMQPEKSFNEPIKLLSESIITIKRNYEAEQRAIREKEAEKLNLVQSINMQKNDADAFYKTKINNYITKAFEHALQNAEITPDNVDGFIKQCDAKYSVADFTPQKPVLYAKYHTAQDVEVLLNEHWRIDSSGYVLMFQSQLRNKFSDFSVAFHNKQDALIKAKKEEEERLKAIEAEKQNKNLANQIDTMSTPLNAMVTPNVSALRKSYEVDMPETVESVIAIMAAFTANLPLCLPKLKVNKWFSFTPNQAAIALSKVKCDDNNFKPQGITFKEVDKL